MNCTSKERGLSCDGHGYVCLPHGICVCDSGWTGFSPFLGGYNNSCDVHEDTMFGLAIIESLLASIYILIVLRHIGKRLIMTKNFKLFLYDPKTLCSFLFFLIGVTDIALSVSYLVHSRKRGIMDEMPTAVATGLHAFFCFSGLSAYFQIQLHFLKSSLKLMNAVSRQKILSHLTLLRNFSWSVVPFSVPISLSSILSVTYPSSTREFAMTFIIGVGLLLSFYVILFLTALGYIVAELTSHLRTFHELDAAAVSPDALYLVCSRLKLAYRVGGISMMGGAALTVLFGSWSFLYSKFVYLGFVLRLTSLLLFFLFFITISGISSPSSIIPSNTPHSSTKLSGRTHYGPIAKFFGIQNQLIATTNNVRINDNVHEESSGTGNTSVMSRPSTYRMIRKSFILSSH